MMIVLAFGTSSPLSMIVVQTSTSSLPLKKFEHHPLELMLLQLAVADADLGLGHQLAQLIGDMVDALDAVMHEVDLAAAIQLAQDRLAHQLIFVRQHIGLDRHAILGRRVDHAQVADAGQRHVQRARDRCGRQRQHIHVRAHLLDTLLVAHAEALLLIHHQQPQILEVNIFRQQPVRADDDIDLAASPASE